MPETKKIQIKAKATAQEILEQLAISNASKKAGAKALRNAAKATPVKKGRTKEGCREGNRNKEGFNKES